MMLLIPSFNCWSRPRFLDTIFQQPKNCGYLNLKLAICTLCLVLIASESKQVYGSQRLLRSKSTITSNAGAVHDVIRAARYAPGGTARRNSRVRRYTQTYASYYSDSSRLKYSRRVTPKQAAFLEAEHNKYRRLVPATDMEYMYWDQALAESAQKHADTCNFLHSTDRPRGVGENIWADNQSNFQDAVYLWYVELHQYSCTEYFSHSCGHFTQVVQARASRFGCGAAACHYTLGVSRSNILVCQYSAGNVWGKPAFNAYGSHGKAHCTKCPKHLHRCYEGLCA